MHFSPGVLVVQEAGQFRTRVQGPPERSSAPNGTAPIERDAALLRWVAGAARPRGGASHAHAHLCRAGRIGGAKRFKVNNRDIATRSSAWPISSRGATTPATSTRAATRDSEYEATSPCALAGLELTVHFWRKRVPEPQKVSRKRPLEDESSDEEAGRSRQLVDNGPI